MRRGKTKLHKTYNMFSKQEVGRLYFIRGHAGIIIIIIVVLYYIVCIVFRLLCSSTVVGLPHLYNVVADSKYPPMCQIHGFKVLMSLDSEINRQYFDNISYYMLLYRLSSSYGIDKQQ